MESVIILTPPAPFIILDTLYFSMLIIFICNTRMVCKCTFLLLFCLSIIENYSTKDQIYLQHSSYVCNVAGLLTSVQPSSHVCITAGLRTNHLIMYVVLQVFSQKCKTI